MEEYNFEKFVLIADANDDTMADKGTFLLYEVFKHLSEGGTINDFPGEGEDALSGPEIMAMLAVSWLDLRTFGLVKAEAGEMFEE